MGQEVPARQIIKNIYTVYKKKNNVARKIFFKENMKFLLFLHLKLIL